MTILISRVFSLKESSKLENAAMDLSSVLEALVTIRAARDKMKGKSEGKGELAVSFSGKGEGKWRKPNSAKHLQDNLAARKSKSTCRVWQVIGLGSSTWKSRTLLGQYDNFQIARTSSNHLSSMFKFA